MLAPDDTYADAPSAPTAGAIMSDTFVTFDLGGETLGVEVGHVREILDKVTVNRLPNANADSEGMIDIRGESIPIVDMAGRLGLPRNADGEDTRIIVFEIGLAEDRRPVGVFADLVRDVTRIGPEQIERPPTVAGSHWEPAYLNAIARHGGELILLLDIQQIFGIGATADELDPAFL